MAQIDNSQIDVLESGEGPVVILVHSSVSGARQWRKLSQLLATNFHVKAINLFGYGQTPPWSADRMQNLSDQAALVEAIVPNGSKDIALVGHSFGGSVAMRAAANLGNRVKKLVLLEPNPFHLLHDHGYLEAYDEIKQLRHIIKTCGANGEWVTAAEHFANYWGGAGSWASMDQDRRATFATALKPNFHEWDAILNETTSLNDWVGQLPSKTLVVYDNDTVRPIKEIVLLMSEAAKHWKIKSISKGGHMAPLTHPELINPLVAEFLTSA